MSFRLFIVVSAVAASGMTTPTYAGDGPFVRETAYVEVPFDTDGDGRMDRIYVSVDREAGGTNLPVILAMSPYALGGNDVANHDVDVRRLPQDGEGWGARLSARFKDQLAKNDRATDLRSQALARGYAALSAHSLGTGNSTGCPSVGDETETLAAKAVIDWLGGRARAYSANGQPVMASWASGAVGMTGVSYNGTLPNMVATTGVEGLKAIVPVAAISSWYDYYRANGLVVGPGGYIGEDADVLGKFIVRSGTCSQAMTRITETMGREHGDFDQFWQDRDYVGQADGVRAAVFIMHGQSDWNVKQRHAIRWWEALQGRVPLKMWLHKGGHGHPSRPDTSQKTWAWFDRYVKGVQNGIEDEAPVEVESPTGTWTSQQAWPSELTSSGRFYLNAGALLSETPAADASKRIVDSGKTTRLDAMLANPTQDTVARLAFVTAPLGSARLLSGTPHVTLALAVMNRRAANVTVAVVEYDANGRGRIVTRGWMDPQNHADFARGELLVPGQRYQVRFDLEPKQYTFARGTRIGIVVTATDYDYTVRPEAGTEVAVTLGQESYVEMGLSQASNPP